MIEGLEDARKLAHGTYDDVIVVEHRELQGDRHVVLEMPERSRVVDRAQEYDIDGVVGRTAPRVGGSYRLIVAAATSQAGVGGVPVSALRYETMNR